MEAYRDGRWRSIDFVADRHKRPFSPRQQDLPQDHQKATARRLAPVPGEGSAARRLLSNKCLIPESLVHAQSSSEYLFTAPICSVESYA